MMKMISRVFTGAVKTVFVVGDLHGDYQSFQKIVRMHEKPLKDSLLLFLGDYADRGSQGTEIITSLNNILDSREDIIALKGNHELYRNGKPAFSPCDLVYEAETKYSSWKEFYTSIMVDFLSKLHIAAVINKVLFVHAGISSDIKTIKDISNPENEAYLLWSDPSPDQGEHPSMRGAGINFGEDITKQVLSCLGAELIVRSHEPNKAADGPYVEHGGRVITTNAGSYYGKPFILRLDTEDRTYEPVFL
jgi:hypothetical protein